jgi:hypothetical protein
MKVLVAVIVVTVLLILIWVVLYFAGTRDR